MPFADSDLILFASALAAIGYFYWRKNKQSTVPPVPAPTSSNAPVDDWTSLKEKIDSKVNLIAETKEKEKKADIKAVYKGLEEKL